MLKWLRCVAVLPALLLAGCQALGFAAANLPSLFASRQADLRYAPGPRGLLDAYLPAPGAAPPKPLVVFWYGGGFTEGKRSDYRFVGAALASRGYVTLLPDYRVYPEARFPDFLDDAAQAVVFAHDHAASLGADPSRIVLAGHSAGAYIAAMLALDPQYLRRAGGDPAWIGGLVGLSGPYNIDPNSEVLDRVFNATATAEQYRPVRRVQAGAPPTLLIQGTNDKVVDLSHGEKLVAALQQVGTPVEFKRYADRGHADTVAALAVLARRRAPTFRDVVSFLDALDVRTRR